MNQRKPPITSLRIRSFKAVQDSGILRFGHLTAFIGDNGVGKSCPIDALRFLRTLAYGTLDSALEPFGGYEHVHWNAGKKTRSRQTGGGN